MNRTGLGLAIGAGYFLGRTKKLKMALAVGSLVAGKKLNLSPRGVAELVSQQLRDNPQFKEIGDQLRQDLRGVGKAASGAMVERQMTALADRLQGRTAQVRDQLSGVVPGTGSDEQDDRDEQRDDEDARAGSDGRDAAERDSGDRDKVEQEGDDGGARQEGPPRRKAAKKAPSKDAPAKKAAQAKAPAKKTAAKRTDAGRKTAAKKTAAAGGARSQLPKGGDDR
ncbi:DNA primase [Streptomyces sp. TG1A-8]|uniref:DNA primase n=1 Tax=Streptomyces sp. TG1A-8 TaxID=3051385 RepID=UPI00265B9F8D|nr:DNA primase [Streptomyces sp. TG1A-8]MDO0924898.1 DNA primase [Streptomyces sp. TG1A-8]